MSNSETTNVIEFPLDMTQIERLEAVEITPGSGCVFYDLRIECEKETCDVCR